jgi:hypothetical protein
MSNLNRCSFWGTRTFSKHEAKKLEEEFLGNPQRIKAADSISLES